MKIGKPYALGRQAVDLGRFEVRIAKATYAFVSHIIYHHHNQIWALVVCN
jgi:hypothetical protein